MISTVTSKYEAPPLPPEILLKREKIHRYGTRRYQLHNLGGVTVDEQNQMDMGIKHKHKGKCWNTEKWQCFQKVLISQNIICYIFFWRRTVQQTMLANPFSSTISTRLS